MLYNFTNYLRGGHAQEAGSTDNTGTMLFLCFIVTLVICCDFHLRTRLLSIDEQTARFIDERLLERLAQSASSQANQRTTARPLVS